MGDRSQVWETKRVYVRSVNVMTEPGGQKERESTEQQQRLRSKAQDILLRASAAGVASPRKARKKPKKPSLTDGLGLVVRAGRNWLLAGGGPGLARCGGGDGGHNTE